MFPDTIEIPGEQDTPNVLFDNINKKYEISGRSFPADADGFYQPLLQWLDDYKKSKPETETVFEVRMEYFNTASAKMILDIFFKLEDIAETGNEVKIQWYFLEEDEDMLEAGEDYQSILKIPFKMIEMEE